MATVTVEDLLLAIQEDRNAIRAKLVELGLVESSALLDVLATAVTAIVNRGSVSVQIREGDTYVIPEGYHDGTGTVTGIAGGGNYQLQPTKSVTPTKSKQAITPDSGFYGLEGVMVLAIPAIYQDTSSVTAAAADVRAGKVIVLADGKVVAGTLADNGTVTKILDATTVSYTIPAGDHSGEGTVSIVLEEKTVTPTKSEQTVTPATGKVISKVTIDPIPDKYQDISGVTAMPGHVLDGDKYIGADGAEHVGTMPNNGAVSGSVNGITVTEVEIPAGYTSGGAVTFDDSKLIEMLQSI